jgi:SpoVK/Ycf46/Vps4 family AAA+-type ATPase
VIYVLKDIAFLLRNDPSFVRGLRNLVGDTGSLLQRVVLTQTTPFLPPELRNCAVVETLPLPGKADLLKLLGPLPKTDPALADALSEAMKGLTLSRAWQALRFAASECHGYNREAVERVMAEKKQLLVENEALSFVDGAFGMDLVGGLGRLKKWLSLQKVAFTDYGRQNGLMPPRGVLLAGIPGTGKSLAAKAAASVLELPLIKLDISRIFHSYVGESETVCARTIQILTSLAPCVCMIDELDKIFGNVTFDTGITQRVLGQLLHYMQERSGGVFFVATCNHVERLPPELVRKGRFADEIFFVDLPTAKEREEILSIHVERWLKTIGHESLPLSLYAGMMEGFTGAEIEHVVKKALISALNEQRPASPGDLTRAIDAEIPQSRSMAECISEMRVLVSEGRYLSAS